jgi:hypothetical protein
MVTKIAAVASALTVVAFLALVIAPKVSGTMDAKAQRHRFGVMDFDVRTIGIALLLLVGLVHGFIGTFIFLPERNDVMIYQVVDANGQSASGPCSLGADKTIELKRPFSRLGEYGFTVSSLSQFRDQSDDPAHPNRSLAILCEDRTPIGAGHSAHAEVSSKGNGNYSHWSGGLYFSSSDNSDPNTNGRRYKLVFPNK